MASAASQGFVPDYISPLGETLLELLKERGWTQAAFALRTGRSKKMINEIIQGKAPISAETALQFEKVLGTPASFWLNREQFYRETLARIAEEKKLRDQTPQHLAWTEKAE